MRVIALVNQKGGVGKTATALSVGAALAREKRRVLIVDSDPQGSLTTSAGVEVENDSATLYEVLKGTATAKEAIVNAGGYDILPTDIRLSGADIELASVAGRDFLLKEAIDELDGGYDYVFIDCPPSLSVITLMGLTAADSVIIPVQATYLSLKGMAQLLDTIQLVKKRLNPKLDILGAVVTMYDYRKNLDKEVLDSIREAFPGKVFKTTISSNVTLAEAPAFGKDIYKYRPYCKGALQYNRLTEEIIARCENE